jgi:hypothetical protein
VVGASSIAASGSAGFGIGTSTAGSQASDYSFTGPAIDSAAANIMPATLAVSLTNSSLTKTYDGTTGAPPEFMPTYSFRGFASGDSAAAMTHTGSVYDSADVANASKITVLGLVLSEVTGANSGAASDYRLDASSLTLPATITPAPLSVAANDASRSFDGLAFSGGNGVAYVGLVHGETAATLGRALEYTGTSQGAVYAGSYVITPVGLKNSNYTITFTDGRLIISADLQLPTVLTPVAAPQLPAAPAARTPASVGDPVGSPTAALGAPSPVAASVENIATTTVTPAMAPGPEGIVVSMASELSGQSTPTVGVSIPIELAFAPAGFRFVLPQGLLDVAGDAAVIARTAAGDPLPTWLRYIPELGAFVASAVPEGGLPIDLLITAGGRGIVVTVSIKRN